MPLALLIANCGPREVEWPEGLEPLEANRAELPGTVGEIALVSGEEEDYDWVHARARVDAGVDDTWRALQVGDVVADRRAVVSWTVTTDVRPEYAVSLGLHEVVEDVVTVEFDVEWWEGEAGSRVSCRFEKTDGTPFIALMQGHVIVEPVDGGGSAIDVVEHIRAAERGPDRIAQYVQDLYASVLAFTRGEALPDYARQ